MSDWYVMQTLVGHEEKVAERLRRQLLPDRDVALPRRKLKIRKGGSLFDAEKSLFPGYLFFRGGSVDSRERQERFRFLQASRRDLTGFVRIVGMGLHPQPIYRNEESVIWSLMGENELIDYTKMVFENAHARIVSGPLKGFEGIIRKVDRRKARARVELFILGESRQVDLGLEWLEVR